MNGVAPPHRKGAMKAAMAGRRWDELAKRDDGTVVEGQIEAPRAKRPPLLLTEPKGDTPQEYAPQAAMLSMRALVEDVLYGDGRDRAIAAHALAQVSAKFLRNDANVPPPPPPELTPAERAARLDAELAAPDAELTAALERAGYAKAGA